MIASYKTKTTYHLYDSKTNEITVVVGDLTVDAQSAIDAGHDALEAIRYLANEPDKRVTNIQLSVVLEAKK